MLKIAPTIPYLKSTEQAIQNADPIHLKKSLANFVASFNMFEKENPDI